MPKLHFIHRKPDAIDAFWEILRIAYADKDTPEIWKLTTEHVQLITPFHGRPIDKKINWKFLGIPVDLTTLDSALICAKTTYPLMLVEGFLTHVQSEAL